MKLARDGVNMGMVMFGFSFSRGSSLLEMQYSFV